MYDLRYTPARRCDYELRNVVDEILATANVCVADLRCALVEAGVPIQRVLQILKKEACES